MESVQVALRIRPFVQSEIERGYQSCIEKMPDIPQVVVGKEKKTYTFNYVFDENDDQLIVYKSSVHNLIERLFKGYNITVVAYGQTGSGKTYTMGTESDQDGIIPLALQEIFRHKETSKEVITMNVSFIELYNENLYDLLNNKGRDYSMVDIRDSGSGIFIPGLTRVEVKSIEEALHQLILGSQRRMTGATAMNPMSSRSHAIFTIYFKIVPEDNEKGAITSKFHLVDLAGSERTKKTGATGERFKEGININMGLFVLGNVISQLGDGAPFITYRDSKLTRLLQDSLGGNAVTIMIACVSPADYNYEETISTLRYADRAKHIKNKPIVNQDPATAEIYRLKKENEELKIKILSSLACTSSNCIHEMKLKDALKQNELLIKKFDSTFSESSGSLHEREMERIEKIRMGNIETDTDVLITEIAKSDDHHAINQADLSDKIQHISERLQEKEELVEKLRKENNAAEVPVEEIDTLKEQLHDVNCEKEQLQNEINKISSERTEMATAKISEMRRQKLIELEQKHSALLKKVTELQRVIKIKEKSDVQITNLKEEIKSMKQMKVRFINQLHSDNEKFRSWKNMKEREIIRLKSENTKNQHQLNKIERKSNQQQILLKRKLAAAVAANKKIKDTLERQLQRKIELKSPLRLDDYLAHEIDVIDSVIQARKSLDAMIQDRAFLTKEMNELKARLEDENTCSEEKVYLEPSLKKVKEELDLRTTQIADLQQKLLDSKMDEKAKVRWDCIQSMSDAKSIMSSLFCILTDTKKENYNQDQLLAEVRDLLEESLLKNETDAQTIVDLNNEILRLSTQIQSLHGLIEIQEEEIAKASNPFEGNEFFEDNSSYVGESSSRFQYGERFYGDQGTSQEEIKRVLTYSPKKRYRYFPDENEPEYNEGSSSEKKKVTAVFFTEDTRDSTDFQEQFKTFLIRRRQSSDDKLSGTTKGGAETPEVIEISDGSQEDISEFEKEGTTEAGDVVPEIKKTEIIDISDVSQEESSEKRGVKRRHESPIPDEPHKAEKKSHSESSPPRSQSNIPIPVDELEHPEIQVESSEQNEHSSIKEIED